MRWSRRKSQSDSGTIGVSVSLIDKILPDRRIADGVLPEHAVDFERDGELDPFHFVEENDDEVQVNHLALTYRSPRQFYDQE
jgi:hypothetical protein